MADKLLELRKDGADYWVNWLRVHPELELELELKDIPPLDSLRYIKDVKEWFGQHDGQDVYLYQMTYTEAGRPMNAWAPGLRKVDASRQTYVTLGDSRRDYSGMIAHYMNDDVLVATGDWGDDRVQVMVYIAGRRPY